MKVKVKESKNVMIFLCYVSLPSNISEKCPNTEFFVVHIFPSSDKIRIFIQNARYTYRLCIQSTSLYLVRIREVTNRKNSSLRKKCLNTEFLLVRIFPNTDQEKLLIRIFFAQCVIFALFT